ncbi:MAG TPA: Mut7-C RNAse domain-containing protein [Chloroflexia bacterium]|nr:Mut7-C RNAse domain-containing protein [Chloroflexia bacterium]
METAILHFYGALNDHLSFKRQNTDFSHNFDGRVSVKDMIESLGVPHTEVEAITVNGKAVDFSYLVADSDRVEVYGINTPAPVEAVPLRPPLPEEICFVLDTHLGQLAAYLRMLGFDTLYRNDYPDEELAEISSLENRILLTRDRGLLKRSLVTYGYYVRETNPKRQVVEILGRYHLADRIEPLRRCIRCNGSLKPVSKAAILDRLDPKTRELFDEFSLCTICDQLYWKGSHYESMRRFINELLTAD